MANVANNKSSDRSIIAVISIAWALFQLSLPRFVILDTITIRAVHLAFAITLVFLTVPVAKYKTKRKSLYSVSRLSLVDYILAGLASLAVLYIVLDWTGISMRAGVPIRRDFVIGVILIIFVLEASRRVIGPALGIIAILFTLYATDVFFDVGQPRRNECYISIMSQFFEIIICTNAVCGAMEFF